MTMPKKKSLAAEHQHESAHSKKAPAALMLVAINGQETYRTIAHKQAQSDVALCQAGLMTLTELREKYKTSYTSHRNMKQRAKDLHIDVSPAFIEFTRFLSLAGPVPNKGDTLDRIDPTGPYSPENVRWADKTTQARNRTNVRHLTVNGETKPLTQWAEELGVNANTMRQRKRNGWTDEENVKGSRLKPHTSHGSSAPASPRINFSVYLPWAPEDIERWERAYLKGAIRCSRLEFAIERCENAMRRIEEEVERRFPPNENYRTEEEPDPKKLCYQKSTTSFNERIYVLSRYGKEAKAMLTAEFRAMS